MDSRTKKALLIQNNHQCKYGFYQNVPVFTPTKCYYDHKFNLSEATNYCDVLVKHLHPLLIVKEMKMMGHNPAVLSIVSNEFDGSNIDTFEGFYDEYLNLRTNYCKTVTQHTYPLHGPEIIYTKNLYVIRDEHMTFLRPNNFYSFNHIVASPTENPKLYRKKLKLDDYVLTKELVETIFQTAILGENDVLILNDFGCKSNKIPLNDIIDLYNLNILKYGHFFKYIIVAVPLIDPADKGLYLLFEKEIIKPQNLVNPDTIEIKTLNNKLTVEKSTESTKDEINKNDNDNNENKQKLVLTLLNMLQQKN